jgi:hypothetical protein
MQCSLAASVAGPAHPPEPVFEVEEQKEVRAQVAQGIAWPPPSRKRRTTVSAARSNAGNSLAARRGRQDNPEKFTRNRVLSSRALYHLMEFDLCGAVALCLCTANAKAKALRPIVPCEQLAVLLAIAISVAFSGPGLSPVYVSGFVEPEPGQQLGRRGRDPVELGRGSPEVDDQLAGRASASVVQPRRQARL